MEINQEILERIDQHLEGKLSGEALRVFEERLDEEPAFKELVNQQALLIRVIQKKELLAVKKKLDIFHEDIPTETASIADKTPKEAIIRPLNSSRKQNLTWLAMAASILLLVWGYFNFMDNSAFQTQEELVATARKYIKIPIQNKAGIKQGAIQMQITPSLEKAIQYTLTTEALELYLTDELISKVDLTLYTSTQTPNIFFIKIADDYYQLLQTEQLKTANKVAFSKD